MIDPTGIVYYQDATRFDLSKVTANGGTGEVNP